MPRQTLLCSLFGAAVLWTGCGEECPPGKQPHRVSGNCVDEPTMPEGLNPILRPDAGPRDVGPDSGVNNDGGLQNDGGGQSDGGDGGVQNDVGPSPPAPFAQFTYRERSRPLSGTIEVVAGGLFVDEGPATVQRSAQTIMDDEGRPCHLSVRRLSAGRPQPYDVGAARLVAGGGEVPLVSGVDGSLNPVSPPPIGFATNAAAIALEIQGGVGPFGLAAFSLSVAGPMPISVLSPTPTAQLDLVPSPLITWIPPPGLAAITVEVATVDRTVVLVCGVVNDGIYQLASATVDAFWVEAGPNPAALEIRTETVATLTASVDGQPIVPVTFQVANGVVSDVR